MDESFMPHWYATHFKQRRLTQINRCLAGVGRVPSVICRLSQAWTDATVLRRQGQQIRFTVHHTYRNIHFCEYSVHHNSNNWFKFSYLQIGINRWLRTIFKVGLQRPIVKEDIYECMPQHSSQNLSAAFDKHWSNEKCRKKPSLLRVLHRTYTEKFFLFGFVIMFLDTATKWVWVRL